MTARRTRLPCLVIDFALSRVGPDLVCADDADCDGVSNPDEMACGSDPFNSIDRPERIDGEFAGADENGNNAAWETDGIDNDADGMMDEANEGIDEPLPAGAASFDCDGDGYSGAVETHVGTTDQDPCGSAGWPADLRQGTWSVNEVNIEDLASFIGPVRRLGTSPGDSAYDARWDLIPGGDNTWGHISTEEIANLLVVAPPMLDGARAWSEPPCPWEP